MKTFIAIVAASTALMFAGVASAHGWHHHHHQQWRHQHWRHHHHR